MVWPSGRFSLPVGGSSVFPCPPFSPNFPTQSLTERPRELQREFILGASGPSKCVHFLKLSPVPLLLLFLWVMSLRCLLASADAPPSYLHKGKETILPPSESSKSDLQSPSPDPCTVFSPGCRSRWICRPSFHSLKTCSCPSQRDCSVYIRQNL